MLGGIFAKHALFSQMKFKGNQVRLYIERIATSKKPTSSSSTGSSSQFNGPIDVEIIRGIFWELCSEKDIENISLMLTFDYRHFLNLQKSHPYYLTEPPFKDNSVILDALEHANYVEDLDLSKLLLEHLSDWLLRKINGKGGIFTTNVARALHLIALSQPKITYNGISRRVETDYKLTKDDFNSEGYEEVLKALEVLAVTRRYFQYAATLLLQFSAREARLGVYHRNYKAIEYLKSLFLNACAQTRMSLKGRIRVLKQLLLQAEESKDYYKLYALMKVFGTAASVFETGEHTYHEDPDYIKYIHFAIESLSRFAGRQDENGLCSTAEEMLHKILKETCTEDIYGASDAPFIILKLFLESQREWDVNPFYSLNDLEEYIDELKNEAERDEEYIKTLEHKLQRLISLVADREFIAHDFKLFLGAKEQRKDCEIGEMEDPQTDLDLHERLSLTERLIYSETTRIVDIERGWPKCTYVVGSFGIVVSTIQHEPRGQHLRVFYSIPLKVPDYVIAGRKAHQGGHAEEALYQYLLQDENIHGLINELRIQNGIIGPGYKVYAVILDLHGTYDMCLSCSVHGLKFQDTFREKLRNILKIDGLKTLRKCPSQLPMVIRYSSDFRYHYRNTDQDTKKGVLSLVEQEGEKRDLGSSSHDNHYRRDLNQFGANLLIHGKSNWHALWSYTKVRQFKNRKLPLEDRTAFVSDYQYNSLTGQQKQHSFTQNGLVDTSPENPVIPDISKLSLG